MQDLARFLGILEEGPSSTARVFNPWRDHDARDRTPRAKTPAQRRANLEAYLQARLMTARVMLMGEALSHLGGRFSGIPFCSEVELVTKAGLVAKAPLALTSKDCETKPKREMSAGIVWSELERAGCAFEVVLWNAFPWQPYRQVLESNRRPPPAEAADGRLPLRTLLDCFTHRLQVFAVGRVPQESLARWTECECAGYIRHPSMGGANAFREGFRKLVAARL